MAKIKVVVIDDNKDITYSMKKTLETLDKDYEIHCANSGEDGILLAEVVQPDIILLDIMMPDMSGWTVNKSLKSNPKTQHIPVVFVTAKGDDISKEIGKQGGAGYVTKPFEVTELDRVIKDAIK